MSSNDLLKFQRRNVKQSLGLSDEMGMDDLAQELVKDEDLCAGTVDSKETTEALVKSTKTSEEFAGSARERQMQRRKSKMTIQKKTMNTSSIKQSTDSKGAEVKLDRPFPMLNDNEEKCKGLKVALFRLQSWLFSSHWVLRHGALLGIKAISPALPKHCRGLLAQQVFGVMILDRFADYIGDQVVAPVRETAAATVTYLGHEFESLETWNMQMCLKLASHQNWNVRLSGLLGLKHALRIDANDQELSTKFQKFEKWGGQIASVALQGLADSDEDIRSVSAVLLAQLLKDDFICKLAGVDEGILEKIRSILGEIDELAPSLVPLLDLTRLLIERRFVPSDGQKLTLLTVTMLPYLRHPLLSVRNRAICVLLFLPWPLDETHQNSVPLKVVELSLRVLLQAVLLEEDDDIHENQINLFKMMVQCPGICGIVSRWQNLWLSLLLHPVDSPFNPRQFIFLRGCGASSPDPPAHELLFRQADMMLVPVDHRIKVRVRLAKMLRVLPLDFSSISIPSIQSSALSRCLLGIIGAPQLPDEPRQFTEIEVYFREAVVRLESEGHSKADIENLLMSQDQVKICNLSSSDEVWLSETRMQISLWQKRLKACCGNKTSHSTENPILLLLDHLSIEPVKVLREYSASLLATHLICSTIVEKLAKMTKNLATSSKSDDIELLGVKACISKMLESNVDSASKLIGLIVIKKDTYSPYPLFLLTILLDELRLKPDKNIGEPLKEVIAEFIFFNFDQILDIYIDICARAFTGLIHLDLSNDQTVESVPLANFVVNHLDTWTHHSERKYRLAVVAIVECLIEELFEKDTKVSRPTNTKVKVSLLIVFVKSIMELMSDHDEDVRSRASLRFGSLVRLIPLHERFHETKMDDKPIFLAFKQRLESSLLFVEQLLGDQQRISDYPISIPMKIDPRPYQRVGINWMAFLKRNRLHGILADDMGLGKTLQTLVILASDAMEQRKSSNDGEVRPSLVVCPASLVGHWKHEAESYFPTLQDGQVVCIAGPFNERRAAYQFLAQRSLVMTSLVIISYESLRSDFELYLRQQLWSYIVLDEGHAIRNPHTKLSITVKALRGWHRLILTGTPIQNDVLELWALFDFLMPGFLGDEGSFMSKYARPILAVQPRATSLGVTGRGTKRHADSGDVIGDPTTNTSDGGQFEKAEERLAALHKQVLPFMLRRMKEDVLEDLPPKIIQDRECEANELQRLLFDRVLSAVGLKEKIAETFGSKQSRSDEAKGEKPPMHVFQALQWLRKVCLHPGFVLDSSLLESDLDVSTILQKLNINTSSGSLLDQIRLSPKLSLLADLLIECGIANGEFGDDSLNGKLVSSGGLNDSSSTPAHRALIFCQHKATIDLVEKVLIQGFFGGSIAYLRMDGTTDSRARFELVQQFNRDPSISLMLLTTQVGGLGLNLTSADTVILLEHDWNPQRDLQAMDRAHRLGQRRTVMVYRLILADSLEQQIMGMQAWKKRVAGTIVTQQNDGSEVQNVDMLGLLSSTSATSQKISEDSEKSVRHAAVIEKMIGPIIPDLTEEERREYEEF